jgi:hypothetical protein
MVLICGEYGGRSGDRSLHGVPHVVRVVIDEAMVFWFD